MWRSAIPSANSAPAARPAPTKHESLEKLAQFKPAPVNQSHKLFAGMVIFVQIPYTQDVSRFSLVNAINDRGGTTANDPDDLRITHMVLRIPGDFTPNRYDLTRPDTNTVFTDDDLTNPSPDRPEPKWMTLTRKYARFWDCDNGCPDGNKNRKEGRTRKVYRIEWLEEVLAHRLKASETGGWSVWRQSHGGQNHTESAGSMTPLTLPAFSSKISIDPRTRPTSLTPQPPTPTLTPTANTPQLSPASISSMRNDDVGDRCANDQASPVVSSPDAPSTSARAGQASHLQKRPSRDPLVQVPSAKKGRRSLDTLVQTDLSARPPTLPSVASRVVSSPLPNATQEIAVGEGKEELRPTKSEAAASPQKLENIGFARYSSRAASLAPTATPTPTKTKEPPIATPTPKIEPPTPTNLESPSSTNLESRLPRPEKPPTRTVVTLRPQFPFANFVPRTLSTSESQTIFQRMQERWDNNEAIVASTKMPGDRRRLLRIIAQQQYEFVRADAPMPGGDEKMG